MKHRKNDWYVIDGRYHYPHEHGPFETRGAAQNFATALVQAPLEPATGASATSNMPGGGGITLMQGWELDS